MSDADLQRAAQALARARERITTLERARAAPVAIVGVGLRLPGDIDTPDALWSALCERRDLTGPVPEDRQQDLVGLAAGGPGALHGGWLANIDRFAADRFGVSAREAATMDPQQRLLLETSLAATERANLRDEDLRGSRTGVYVGVCNNDYAHRFFREPGDPRVDASLGTGNSYSMAAGRIAYAFGLTGPAFALDAACASSLLAVHLAIQAIRSGECERALVGGVNLVLSPNPSLAFARMGVLSPTGRCRAMDASADGYLRADGCVMLVLEDLARAQASGRPIVAVLRGSAVRQNGTGNGLVAPNPGAQEAVIRAALRDADLTPAQVGLVSAFGGGTTLGDLAEITALERCFAGPRQTPLHLALCKPNFGHAEGASGATSLLLACEALTRKQIPPVLLATGPDPRLPFANTRLSEQRTAWQGPDPIAGVSAFAFNGTNVHLILSAAPPSPPPGEPSTLDRQRHWTAAKLGAAAPDTSFPDLDLLRAAPRDVRRTVITRTLTRALTRALGHDLDPAAPLTLDSLLAVDLLARIRQAWSLTVFPGELLAQPTIHALATHLSTLLDAPTTPTTEHHDLEHTLPTTLRRGRPAPAPDQPADPTLPAPIFLLSTPRSGSTLLRAMLGGHPALFAPPELHLLAFADLADWQSALAPDLLHLGMHQALLGLGLSDAELTAEISMWTSERRPISAAYDALRARAAPRRLIDKSPSYALDPRLLARAEHLFPQARYIHLVRHPIPTCRSFVQRRMGKLLGHDGLDSPRAAAQVWTIGNQNLLDFLADLAPDRVLQIHYEALVRDPPPVLARICEFLGLAYDPAMADPHARRFPGEERGVVGDPGFYARKGVDPELADRWQTDPAADDLSPGTAAVAARLGYDLGDGPNLAALRLDPTITPQPPDDRPAHETHPADQPATQRAAPPAHPPRRLLLTGATGFLGPWLLRALLQRTPADIVALVRARDDADATRRLHAALAHLPGLDLTRVHAIAGHLDRPRLGLTDATWTALADSLDQLVHNGAAVNFARSWQQLAAVNVDGTTEALRLACAGRPTRFIHVSTKGIFDPAVYPGTAAIAEDDPIRPPAGPLLGYQRSKWAAESLVRQAGARGLPIAVVRPGRISGDLATGGLPESDFMVVFIRGCLEIAALPRLDFAIEVSPVDLIAAAIAEVAATATDRTYHLTHPHPIDLREIATILTEQGAPLELLPYPQWRARLLARAEGPGSALAPLLSMFPAHDPPRIDDRRLAHTNTEALLADTTIAWPPMQDLIRSTLAFMRTRGLL